jgi:integrase/recombinase XerD
MNVSISLGDGYIKRNGEAVVYIIIFLKGKKLKFNTGISVKPDQWDRRSRRVKPDVDNFNDLNLVITSCLGRINDVFIKYRLLHRELTPVLLKKEYSNPTYHVDFFTFLERAIEERRGEITDSSIKQHLVLLEKLKEFKPDLSFAEIDTDFIKKFNRWLINTKKNSQNTRHNAFKNLKAYLNIAVDKEIIRANPIKKIPVSRSKTDPDWLTETELHDLVELYKKNYFPGSYQKVVRHFLFSCFTGLRISDVMRLKNEDIVDGRIILVPHKIKNRSPRTIKIPLCKFAEKLIKDENSLRLYGTVFNMLSEQKTNIYLKEAVKVAKINKHVSFHTARHTFATLFLKRTKNIIALQKLLGHSRLTETMVYSHILTEEIDQEMENAFGSVI